MLSENRQFDLLLPVVSIVGSEGLWLVASFLVTILTDVCSGLWLPCSVRLSD
jgi:hypothetical protein